MTNDHFCELLQFACAVGFVTQVHKQISPWLKKLNYHLWLAVRLFGITTAP